MSDLGPLAHASVNWAPFVVTAVDAEKAPYTRSLMTKEGVGDRLRFVAFAECQASAAFAAAAECFLDAAPTVREIWRELALEEEKHMTWLLNRLTELGLSVDERPVHDALWRSFATCKTAHDFASYMAGAEERGRIAGEKFSVVLKKSDPITAAIFEKIAAEEIGHIAMAEKAFGLVVRGTLN
jgi:uncharacterized ferritin-like protein (DUF455 family)